MGVGWAAAGGNGGAFSRGNLFPGRGQALLDLFGALGVASAQPLLQRFSAGRCNKNKDGLQLALPHLQRRPC